MARTVWLVYAYTEFGVLLKGRQRAAVVKGWWPESFHQAANISERGLLQVMQLPQGFCLALASWRRVHGSLDPQERCRHQWTYTVVDLSSAATTLFLPCCHGLGQRPPQSLLQTERLERVVLGSLSKQDPRTKVWMQRRERRQSHGSSSTVDCGACRPAIRRQILVCLRLV